MVDPLAPQFIGGRPILPDLVPAAATGVRLETCPCPDALQVRRRLRFRGYVHNAGPGPLEIRRRGPSEHDGATIMTETFQRAFTTAAGPYGPFVDITSAPSPVIDGADRPDGIEPSLLRGVQPRAARLRRKLPAAPEVVMGIQGGGWDVYGADLSYQCIDVSDVPAGRFP